MIVNATVTEVEIGAVIGIGAGTEVVNGTGVVIETVDASPGLQRAEAGVVVLHAKEAGGKEEGRGRLREMRDGKSIFKLSLRTFGVIN